MDDTDIVARFNAAITAADIGALAGLITDDHRFVDSAGNEIAGREEVLAAWRGFLPPALELAGAKNPRGEISGRRQTPGAETWELEYTLRYD